MPYLVSAFGAGWRHHLWLALLVAASLGFTFGFACAVPFAAFGAVAALSLSRRDALLLMLALWLVNQIVGFGVMHYTWDTMTVAWGGILGAIAVFSTLAAQAAIVRNATIAAAGCFAAAFGVYEGGLYLISTFVMGGAEDFITSIVVRIFEINGAAFLGLLATAFLIAAASAPRRAPLPLVVHR